MCTLYTQNQNDCERHFIFFIPAPVHVQGVRPAVQKPLGILHAQARARGPLPVQLSVLPEGDARHLPGEGAPDETAHRQDGISLHSLRVRFHLGEDAGGTFEHVY